MRFCWSRVLKKNGRLLESIKDLVVLVLLVGGDGGVELPERREGKEDRWDGGSSLLGSSFLFSSCRSQARIKQREHNK